MCVLKGGQDREFGNGVSNLLTAIQISFVLPFLVSEMGRFYLNLVPSASHFTLACRHVSEKTERQQEQRQVINSFSIKFLQRHIPEGRYRVLNVSIQGPDSLIC